MECISTFYGEYFVRKVLFTGLDPHKKDLDFNEFCIFEMYTASLFAIALLSDVLD